MGDVRDAVDRWNGAGKEFALATVVGVRRSAPRPPSAKMAVSADGEIVGAVSGGYVGAMGSRRLQDATGGRIHAVGA